MRCVPVSEADGQAEHVDPTFRASMERAMKQATAGEFEDLGSFAPYASDEDDEEK